MPKIERVGEQSRGAEAQHQRSAHAAAKEEARDLQPQSYGIAGEEAGDRDVGNERHSGECGVRNAECGVFVYSTLHTPHSALMFTLPRSDPARTP